MEVLYYKLFNCDLQHLSHIQLINHYNKYGYYENRMYNKKHFYIKHPNFNFVFYGMHYDLNNLNEFELIQHYWNFGKKENRLTNVKMFFDLFPEFNREFYKKIYDLNNLLDEQVYIHYWITGKNNNYIYSISYFYKYNPYFNFKNYQQLNYNLNLLEEIDCIKHFINIGSKLNNYLLNDNNLQSDSEVKNKITYNLQYSFDLEQLNIYPKYNFNNLLLIEYINDRNNKLIVQYDEYYNLINHEQYFNFIKQSIIDKKISIICPLTYKMISTDIYFILKINVEGIYLPHLICNYVFDSGIIMGIGLGTGIGQMDTRILYVYVVKLNYIYYFWHNYNLDEFKINIIPKINYMYNEIIKKIIELKNINSEILSLYGYGHNYGHYLFNDLTGFYILHNDKLFNAVDKIFFGDNDNFYIKEFINKIYPNIKIIELNNNLNYFNNYIGKGVIFKYNHFFLSNKCVDFIKNDLIIPAKRLFNYSASDILINIKNYYPIINIVLRVGDWSMIDQINVIVEIIKKILLDWPNAYFYFDGFVGCAYYKKDNKIINTISEYEKIVHNIILNCELLNVKLNYTSLINMNSFEIIDYLYLVTYNIYQLGSGCCTSAWICNKNGFQFGREKIKIYELIDKNIKEEMSSIIYFNDINKIKYYSQTFEISSNIIYEFIKNNVLIK